MKHWHGLGSLRKVKDVLKCFLSWALGLGSAVPLKTCSKPHKSWGCPCSARYITTRSCCCRNADGNVFFSASGCPPWVISMSNSISLSKLTAFWRENDLVGIAASLGKKFVIPFFESLLERWTPADSCFGGKHLRRLPWCRGLGLALPCTANRQQEKAWRKKKMSEPSFFNTKINLHFVTNRADLSLPVGSSLSEHTSCFVGKQFLVAAWNESGGQLWL